MILNLIYIILILKKFFFRTLICFNGINQYSENLELNTNIRFDSLHFEEFILLSLDKKLMSLRE